jgi:hypothetical protein
MNIRRRLVRGLWRPVAVLAFVCCADRAAEATPPSGVMFTVLNRATVPAFHALRRFQQAGEDSDPVRGRTWKIELEATQMVDVVTVLFTVQPGGHSGWHTHPGPALFTVSVGSLTMYEGHDPACTAQPFPAGTGSIEAGTREHIHILRNETNAVAETIVAFLVPVGSDIRTDLPDPGNCPF